MAVAKKQGARAGVTRAPMKRIYVIHEAILAGRYPNCRKLGEQLEVSDKTIQRDIDFMRDELRLPVEYDQAQHGYCYTEDVSQFPVFELDASELAGLFLARQALEVARGTKLGRSLRETFAKLTKMIEGRVEFSWAEADKVFSRKPGGVAKADLKLFGELAEAVLGEKEVAFHYRKLGEDRATQRRLRPYHLGEVDGCWYLIGHDLDRGAMRTFALPRLSRLKVSGRGFERPAGFDGADYLRDSFGVWTAAEDEALHVVRVELSGYAARMAQERRWHPTQEIRHRNTRGTRVEVRFQVSRLEELVRWVLSWGSKARVLDPPELKNLVREEVRLMGGR